MAQQPVAFERVDGNAVAVVHAGPEILGEDVRAREALERVLGQQTGRAMSAVAGNHPHVRAHVARSRRNATRAPGRDQRRRFAQPAVPCIRPVAAERRVVPREALAHFHRDDGLAAIHLEGPQDPLAQQFRQLASVEGPGEDAEYVVHRVVVVEVFARRVRREVVQLGVGLEDVAGAGKAGGVRQQMVCRDRGKLRIDPAAMAGIPRSGGRGTELALVVQLEERERHE